jgi:hypothetical protein
MFGNRDGQSNPAGMSRVIRWMKDITIAEWMVAGPSILILCTAAAVYFKEELSAGMLALSNIMLLAAGLLLVVLCIAALSVFGYCASFIFLYGPFWLGRKMLIWARPVLPAPVFEICHLLLRNIFFWLRPLHICGHFRHGRIRCWL